MEGSTTDGLPAGFPGGQAFVSCRIDFLSSVTGRVGYAIDRTLLYGKAGVAWRATNTRWQGRFREPDLALRGLMHAPLTAGVGVE